MLGFPLKPAQKGFAISSCAPCACLAQQSSNNWQVGSAPVPKCPQIGAPVKLTLYARVSTHNGQDPELQLRELREYCKRRGCELVGEFVDIGISGAKDSRPELNRLMAEAHKRRFDAVAVWRFDRFARSVSHLLRALETFRSLDIEFISLSEQMDTSTPTGKMVFTVLGAVAELERSLIAERVRAGLRNARAKGKTLGRPKSDVDHAEVRRLRAQGASWRVIGRNLGVSATTAFYAGQTSVCKTLVPRRP
jgi:DNA invertase Pin-like site-specific DNA recombinase